MWKPGLVLVSLISLMALAMEPIFAQHHPMGGDTSSLPPSESPAKHKPQSAELRQAVPFPPEIKLALLQRMRENLTYVYEIQAALAASDFERAFNVAEYKLGSSSVGPHNARQAPYMPDPMQHMGMAMHRSASELAVALQEGDMKKSLEALSTTTAHCVACHATYYAQ